MEPLASKMRPKSLDDFAGQKHLVGENSPIRNFLEKENIPSMIFWGPPGCGKTTLGYIISQNIFTDFYKLSAVNSGKDKLRQIVKIATQNQQYNKKTIMFLDEIHRWNKAQQDALLPYVEKGLVTLIGATTENPSFSINSALLSRTKVFIFNKLEPEEIYELLHKAVKAHFKDYSIHKSVLEYISEIADGDTRSAYNSLEMSTMLAKANSARVKADKDSKKKKPNANTKTKVTKDDVSNAIQRQLYHDKSGDNHYDIISAVHKSMRSSNPDAACYWVMRLLEGGDDPKYVARRLLRFAAEDIGNADPHATVLANSVFDACNKIGMPECDVHLMQLAQYLANAPKDNSAYLLAQGTREDVQNHGNLAVPKHLRNAPTALMKKAGYGKGYVYDHDVKGKVSGQQCMPDKLKGKRY
jgi:putative ATPase